MLLINFLSFFSRVKDPLLTFFGAEIKAEIIKHTYLNYMWDPSVCTMCTHMKSYWRHILRVHQTTSFHQGSQGFDLLEDPQSNSIQHKQSLC